MRDGDGSGTAPTSNPGDVTYLPISAIAELIYCPRNFYYRVVEGATDENAHVIQGRLEEERRNERATVTRSGSVQRRGDLISSERLRLIGIVDALEERGEIYPVEYKKGEAGEKLHDQVQLCAQAMVLEDVTGRPIRRGFLYYGESHTRVPVEFTEDLRALVLRTIEQAFAVVESGVIPEPVNDARCQGCSLQGRCLPAEVRFLQGAAPPPTRPVPGVNPGRVLYVDEPGAYLRKSGERLVVTKDDATLREVPAVNLDEVVLVGNVNFSTGAARLLLGRDIPVSLISGTGEYEGRLQPAFSKAAPLRIAQVQRHLDPSSACSRPGSLWWASCPTCGRCCSATGAAAGTPCWRRRRAGWSRPSAGQGAPRAGRRSWGRRGSVAAITSPSSAGCSRRSCPSSSSAGPGGPPRTR